MPDATHPAVFLDRDGTLNEEVHYLHRTEDFRWIPGAPEAIRRLNDAGFLVIVVTNQSGVARGFFEERDVDRLHAHLQTELLRYGAHVDAFYYSPYHPEGSVARYARATDCRKPGTALFERAIAEWAVDPARSFVVGDRARDLAPGHALGMRTILVETGYGRQKGADADFVTADVAEAVASVLALAGAGERARQA
jgi:D-glycero-D-manno-heptose 1,7-bisphosphate phosphatase